MLVKAPIFDPVFSDDFAAQHAIAALAPARMLRGVLNLSLRLAMVRLHQLVVALHEAGHADLNTAAWAGLAERVAQQPDIAPIKLVVFATEHVSDASARAAYQDLADTLEAERPHALYPTSVYRESNGHTVATEDYATIDAVVSQTTFATIRTVDRVLDIGNPTLADVYGAELRSEVLVVGHHGSLTSTSGRLLQVVQPTEGWISAGFNNRFGHPHPDVLARLHEAGVRTFNTAECGRIFREPDRLTRCQRKLWQPRWRQPL